MTDQKIIDLEKERRVRDVIDELRALLDSDPELAVRTEEWFTELMETSSVTSDEEE